ncbi:MAG: LD-carboxypeptidase [Myxococcota bacterium]|nr:LD-carboxypeptidase [Myxococcota bacterium]
MKRGATLGIAAPAGPIDRERLEAGESMLRKLGFETVCADDITRESGYLAGSDERRAEEFMSLVNDPEVDGIVCARGGYGCHRIIAHLDADVVRKQAKPLVGYSDITTLLLWQLKKAGLMGFHGPMLDRPGSLGAESKRAFSTALLGQGSPPRIAGQSMQRGWGEGRLVGGSLKLVLASLGTPWEIDTRDAVLLFEDTNEAPYSIDRMLMQLVCAGKLERVVGIGIGSLADCTNPTRPRPTAMEVCEELLAPLGVPIVSGLPFGHCDENMPWALGARAAIDGDRGEIELLELAVAKR